MMWLVIAIILLVIIIYTCSVTYLPSSY
ncbi:hypothetical protein P578_02741, partial [Staphylococcus aureus M1443]